MKTKSITDTDIQVAQKLKSSDIAIYTANDDEIKQLLKNDCWTEILEKKAKLITRTFGVIAYIVHVDSIDLVHKNIIIEKICLKNIALIPDLEIKWIGWLINLSLGKKELSLVIECKIAIQAIKAIDKGLAIKAELH